MFTKPGKRIKTLARFNFWFLLIGSIVAGIILLCTDYVPIGLPLLLGGPCIAYVENLLLFGFGDLVDNVGSIQSENKKSNVQLQADFEKKRKLEKLRAQGLITEEEYQQALSNEQ